MEDNNKSEVEKNGLETENDVTKTETEVEVTNTETEVSSTEPDIEILNTKSEEVKNEPIEEKSNLEFETKKDGEQPKMSGKKSKKGKIIGITVLSILLIGIIATVILYFTGILRLNITKKDKMWNGLRKVGETFSDPIDEMTEKSKAKIYDNLENKPVEYSASISTEIEDFDVEGMNSSDKKIINQLLKVLNGSKINLDISSDPEEKEYAGKIETEVDGIIDGVSGDFFYSDGTMGFRSEELSDKYITIDKKDWKRLGGSEIADAVDLLESFEIGDYNDLYITEDEEKHFKDIYQKILEKEIKSKDMKSSSEKITIDGKEKSCTKVEVTLKDKDIADLIGKYLDKFENDEKGREIIIDKISKYSKLSGQEIDKDELEEYIDQIIEKTRDSLDNFEFDGDVKITSYATLLSIYRVDIEYSEGNNSIEISTEFNGKKSETTIKIADQKICKINIKNEKDEKEYKISFNEDLIKGKFDITMNYKSEKNKNTTSFDIEAEFNGQEAYISVSNEEKRTTDTKNELSTENEISFDIDIPNYMTTKGKIMIDGTLEIIDSVDVPKLSKDNSVNIYDTEGMNEYGEEIEKGLMTILGNMQTSNFVQQLIIDNNNQKSMVY